MRDRNTSNEPSIQHSTFEIQHSPSSPELHQSPWLIAIQVLRDASGRVKLLAAAAILYFVVVGAWMAAALGWEALLLPQMWGGLAAGIAGLLLGSAYGLLGVAQEGEWPCRFRWSVPARTINRMLLALPPMVFIAAVMAAAVAVSLLPLALAQPPYWIAVAGALLIVIASGGAVGDVTRFLYRQAREQAAAAERAKTEAADAELAALQAQMNPHFLFNALNTVAALIRTGPTEAEAAVEDLARVLRRTLEHSRRTTTTLGEEVEYLRAYLRIEEARFRDRLRVRWEVEPGALTAAIPPMSLQPLVENAIRHGIGGRLAGGNVTISARREDGRLTMEVADDGAGFAPGRAERTGLGNLRQRLATLYGADAGMFVTSGGDGTRVRIELPAPEGVA